MSDDVFTAELEKLGDDHPWATLIESAKGADVQVGHALGKLVRDLFEKRQSVEFLEEQLKVAKAELEDLETQKIPGLLFDNGLSEVRLKTGERLVIENEVYCSINKADQPAAFAWLAANGHADLLSHELKMNFGRGQADLMLETEEVLKDNNLDYSRSQSIHWQTLRSFVKAQLEDGGTLPETIKWHRVDRAKIKS